MDEDLDRLVELQSGLLTVAQGRIFGLSREAMAHRVRSGRWQRVHPGVYATTTGILDLEQRIWAGYLYAGEGAVVSRRSAWWWADRSIAEPDAVQIDVPHRRVVPGRPGLTITRTRRLDPADVHPVEFPRRFRLERAVLDCAATAESLDQAAALLATAVQHRSTTPDRMLAVLGRCQNLPRRSHLYDVLALAGEGAHTLLEQAQARCCAAHGLPTPDRQRQIGDACVDAAFDMPLGTVIAEFDGKLGHLGAASWWRDMRRDNQHSINGRATLRFPGFVLLRRPHTVAVDIGAALVRWGWTGRVTCPTGCQRV